MSGAERGGAVTTVYRVRDAAGHIVAEHVREDRPDGSKDCRWRRPGGGWGLNGTRLEELPLYGSERLADWPEEYPVILVEGEKAADALNGAGHLFALGTVTGAAGTPGPEALEALRGREVVLWPDADDPGREHMARTAERLRGVAGTLRLYTWHEAPEKGADAADHPAILGGGEKALGMLLNDLLGAPEWEPPGDDPPSTPGRDRPPRGFNLTDLGNAERLVARHGENIRYCHALGKWFCWGGRRWADDRTGRVCYMGRETVRQIGGAAPTLEDADERKALLKWAISSEAKARIDAMIGLAEAEAGIPVAPEELDADPWKLNCLNGTVDLRTGALHPHRREDLITRLAPVEYDPDARSEVWERHLEDATGGDAQLAGFLQRAAGYSLTGDVSEEVLFFVHGPAAAGKSTFLEALKAALGDYATTADFEAFLARREVGGARNDIARLAGARLVASIEVDEGKRLAEGLIKMLTGGDTITARFLYKEAFEFLPTFKLWLAANHAPKVRDDDEAMWRRILRVPFDQVIPKGERDPAVKKTLRNPAAAGPAILAWAVEGCLAWQHEGLGIPPAVEEATQEYRDEMDPLRDFLEDCCVLAPDAWVLTGDLRHAYESWAREQGEAHILRGRQFTDRLKVRGLKAERRHAGRGWRGVGLLAPPPTAGDGSHRDASDTAEKPRKSDKSSESVTDRDGKIGNSQGNSPREADLPNPPSRSVTRHAGDAPPELVAFLADPPAWFQNQAAECIRQGSPWRLVDPLVHAVANELSGRWSEVLPAVEDWLRKEG